MKFLPFLLSLLLVTPAAAGTKYFVNGTSGSDSNDGSSGSPWQTITKANNTLTSGDTVVVAAKGTAYSASINPLNSGTMWIGDSSAYNKVIVPGIGIYHTNTTVNGFRSSADMAIGNGNGTAAGSHVRNTLVAASVYLDDGYLRLQSVRIGTDSTFSTLWMAPSANCVSYADHNSIIDCTMKLRPVDANSTYNLLKIEYQSREGCGQQPDFSYLTFTGNKITLTALRNQDRNQKMTMLNRIRYSTFANNKWTFRDSTGAVGGNSLQGYLLRDYIQHNTFTNDTIEVQALIANTGCVGVFMYSSGNPGSEDDHNAWRYCVIKSDVKNFAAIYNQYGFGEGDSIYRCVIVSKFNSPVFSSPRGKAVFYKNTVACTNGSPAATFDHGGTSGNLMQTRANIFYTPITTSSGTNECAALYVAGTNIPYGTVDYNLYYHGGTNAIDLKYNGVFGRPGAGSNPCNGYGQTCNSVHGSPRFVDSTYATFDYRIGGGAPLNIGPFGEDAGADDSTSDGTRPAQIADLVLVSQTQTTATLRFTAVGDDSLTGTAHHYDVRGSNSEPFTAWGLTFTKWALWFDVNGTEIDNGPWGAIIPTPGVVGTSQTITLTNLQPCTSYWIGVAAIDEAGQSSAPSYPINFTTLGTNCP